MLQPLRTLAARDGQLPDLGEPYVVCSTLERMQIAGHALVLHSLASLSPGAAIANVMVGLRPPALPRAMMTFTGVDGVEPLLLASMRSRPAACAARPLADDGARSRPQSLDGHPVIARLAPVLAAMLVLGCATERGRAWDRPAPAPVAPGVSLVLLGEVGHPGRTAGTVAAEVRHTLAARRAAGVPVVLLWLGDMLGDECDPATALARPGVRDLAELAREHAAAGGLGYAVLGDRRVALRRALRARATGRGPAAVADAGRQLRRPRRP